MYWSIAAKQDATIYEADPYRNTGLDEILEIKAGYDPLTNNFVEARSLIQFDVDSEIAKLKQQEAEVSTKVVTKYIDKIVVVKEKNNEIAKYINKDADAKCQLPVSFSVLHDAAAKNELPDSTRATDATASGIALSSATTTIVGNYGACNQNVEQLKALQEWIREQQKLNP